MLYKSLIDCFRILLSQQHLLLLTNSTKGLIMIGKKWADISKEVNLSKIDHLMASQICSRIRLLSCKIRLLILPSFFSLSLVPLSSPPQGIIGEFYLGMVMLTGGSLVYKFLPLLFLGSDRSGANKPSLSLILSSLLDLLKVKRRGSLGQLMLTVGCFSTSSWR